MVMRTFPLGPFQCNCTVLVEPTTKEAVVFDPGDEYGYLASVLTELEARVVAILLTHAHIDHVGAVKPLQEETGAPVYLHRKETPILEGVPMQAQWTGLPCPELPRIDVWLDELQPLQLLGREIQLLFTPGHSPGSVSYYLAEESLLVSGDVLFHDSIGRTDLPGGDSQQLLASIRQRLWPLPDETVVFPGHGRQTTIGREKKRNPFVKVG